MKQGVPVSPGIAVARAFCVDEVLARREPVAISVDSLSVEISRFDHACLTAALELDAVIARVAKEVGEEQAGIFRAHRLLLRDPALVSKVKAAIVHQRVDALSALHGVLDEYIKLFTRIEDAYLQERMADLRDVVGRVTAHLALQTNQQPLDHTEPVVIVAPEILPSQAVRFERLQVAGILTEGGGATGHAVILARALGIPAITGLRGLLNDIHTGDLIAMDGREGHVYINPGPEIESAYRKLQREYFDLRDRLIENQDQEAVTADGIRVELLANVNGLADARNACRVGASGVGLYRTEYLFLGHASVPNEEEQLATYKAVIEAAPHRAVTIRTLDLGGDKQLPYLGQQREANPFMGWRSIRLSTAHPEFFQTQLRAILRAAHYGKVSLMFPMISTLEEIHRLKRIVRRTQLLLRSQGMPCGEHVPLGIMVEVPAAALCIEDWLDEVDFVSIGSNDLTQYLMAADRDNPKVAHLCEPFAPALFRMLRHIIDACNRHGKPVTLCGEMAGRPRCLLPVLGMGLRRLSMSPAFVPSIKEVVRHATGPLMCDVAERVLRMTTRGEIRSYLTRQIRQLCPNVRLLDMRR
ncbi:MAG: phosphoenolpyruvate--protein phosphotransferase [Gemmataceae bacterium]